CINRGHATAAMEKVIRDGKLWLSRGASVAIFPEGTRSHDGEIHRFKAGAFTLAREAGVEILPVVLDGTTTMIGRNGMFNWRNKLTVSILPPVSAERVAAADPKELMEQVRASMCVRLAEIRKQK
ncbi:lysophospholipid acyltransferase family protein, partial [Alistipes putredinis]